MSNKTVLTVLGCGNSTGVPAIGNYWGECDPQEPKNRRTRCSVALQTAETSIVIDTGPEFRVQMNRENIEDLDGALYTHAHSDHTTGIDELRSFRFRNGALVPVYLNISTLQDLKRRFHYLFDGGDHVLYPPVLEPRLIKGEEFNNICTFGDIHFMPFQQDHGSVQSLGYRFGDLAYSVDMWRLDGQAIEALKGIKTWVVDAAAYHQNENPVHANLQTIFELNEKIGAQQVYLTSLSLAMDYQTLCGELPDGYAPAYDGLKIEFEGF